MSRTIVTERALCWLLVAALLSPSLGQAAPSSAEKAEAEALFQDGKKLMLQKRFAEACRKLEASQRLDPAPGTLINLALCHEEEGKIASAWVEFSDALSQARADRKADRVKIAREHLDRLEPRLPRLSVRLGSGDLMPGLVVTRDDVVMSEASLGTAIPVDPGEHVVRATAPGHLPREARITLDIAERRTLTLPLPEAKPVTSSSVSAAPPPPPPPPPSWTRRQTGYVVGGVGVVALAIGGWAGLRTLSKKRDSDRGCPSATTCTAEGVESNDQAHTYANVANVGLGLGLVGVGVGAYLILSSPQEPAPSAARWVVQPALGRGEGGVQVLGRF